MKLLVKIAALFVLVLPGVSVADETAGKAVDQLTVYKSPTCGCCKVWINHLEEYGFEATTEHPADLDGVKRRLGITSQTASCHTGVSSQGYVFEGHVPAKYIKTFIENPPENAIGLSVPAMPLGSPGMEMEDRFHPYKVIQMNKDGTMQVYASVDEQAQQY